jgi:hypothetical protein
MLGMKLQKHFSRKKGGKDYFKWALNIPIKVVDKLEWKEGEELIPKINGKKFVIKIKGEK